jgi:hypothetical protein
VGFRHSRMYGPRGFRRCRRHRRRDFFVEIWRDRDSASIRSICWESLSTTTTHPRGARVACTASVLFAFTKAQARTEPKPTFGRPPTKRRHHVYVARAWPSVRGPVGVPKAEPRPTRFSQWANHRGGTRGDARRTRSASCRSRGRLRLHARGDDARHRRPIRAPRAVQPLRGRLTNAETPAAKSGFQLRSSCASPKARGPA